MHSWSCNLCAWVYLAAVVLPCIHEEKRGWTGVFPWRVTTKRLRLVRPWVLRKEKCPLPRTAKPGPLPVTSRSPKWRMKHPSTRIQVGSVVWLKRNSVSVAFNSSVLLKPYVLFQRSLSIIVIFCFTCILEKPAKVVRAGKIPRYQGHQQKNKQLLKPVTPSKFLLDYICLV